MRTTACGKAFTVVWTLNAHVDKQFVNKSLSEGTSVEHRKQNDILYCNKRDMRGSGDRLTLVTPKWAPWQTVKTRMKYCIARHFIMVLKQKQPSDKEI